MRIHKKHFLCWISFAVLFFGNAVLVFAEYSPSSLSLPIDENLLEKILHIPVGSQPGEIPYSLNGPLEVPEAFSVGEQGKIYILDPTEKRILIFQEGRWLKDINIELICGPRLMCEGQGNLYVLNEKGFLYQLDENGRQIQKMPLPNSVSALDVKQMYVSSTKGLIMDLGQGRIQSVFSSQDPMKTDSIPVIRQKGLQGELWKGKKLQTVFELKNQDSAAQVLFEDAAGNSYVEVYQMVPECTRVIGEFILWRVDPTGRKSGSFRIPLEQYTSYPLKFFDIHDNGDIYIMEIKEQGLNIQKITLNKEYRSIYDYLKERAKAINAFYRKLDKHRKDEVPVEE